MGALIPGVLLLWVGADVGFRFGPIERLNIIPQLAASRFPGFYSPFLPNRTFRFDPCVGEAALTGNLQPQEARYPLTFTTDALGFRKTPGVEASPDVKAVVWDGASYAYGGALTDSETLAAVLTREQHVTTYNAGRYNWDLQGALAFDWLLKKLDSRPVVFIDLLWEDQRPTPGFLTGRVRGDGIGSRLLGAHRYESLRPYSLYAQRLLFTFRSLSPMEVISTRAFKRISNGEILPNPYAARVFPRWLPDGRRMLLLGEEVSTTTHAAADEQTIGDEVQYYLDTARILAARNCRLLVVLIPNRYTVYGPVFERGPLFSGEHRFDRLERELKQRQIAVVNGLPVMRAAAADDVAAGRLAYFREDHHWNPLGVRRMATALAPALREELKKAGR